MKTRMQLKYIFGVLFLINFTKSAPASDSFEIYENLVVNSDIFLDKFVVYKSDHDIVSLTVPLNSINYSNDSNEDYDKTFDNFNKYITAFFVEADVSDKGQKEYKGLYALKNGTAMKILETGTDASADFGENSEAYFSATDGIYVYDSQKHKIEKYGNITDNLIGIVKTKDSNVNLYVLTEDHEVYRVTDGGNKKEKLEDVKDAQQIVLDDSDNLYFYSEDKVPYVVTEEGVRSIDGLPEDPTNVQLIKPMFFLTAGVLFASDDKLYTIYANGTSDPTEFVLELKPTAYAPEAAFLQYYAYEKKIYEYNLLKILYGEFISHMEEFLFEDNIDKFQSIGTRSLKSFVV